MTEIINGKKYNVTRGGCWDCAFNSIESESYRCAYAEEVGGVQRFRCKLKFGEHYEEIGDGKRNDIR